MPAFGLSDQTLATIRGILLDYPAVERALIYGSRARGTYRPGSDIDLALLGEGVDLTTLGAIAGRLDESSIPQQVDLTLWSRIDHSALREDIQRAGVVFYDRERDGLLKTRR